MQLVANAIYSRCLTSRFKIPILISLPIAINAVQLLQWSPVCRRPCRAQPQMLAQRPWVCLKPQSQTAVHRSACLCLHHFPLFVLHLPRAVKKAVMVFEDTLADVATASAGFLSAPYFCDIVTHVEAPGNTTVTRPLVNPWSLVPALYVYIYIYIHSNLKLLIYIRVGCRSVPKLGFAAFSLAAGRASEMYRSRKVNMMITTAYANHKGSGG